MKCDDALIKCQMLIDDELPENEIPVVMDHIESCYKCREEYISLLKLRKKLNGIRDTAPGDEWFEALHRKGGRRFAGRLGFILFAASYIVLAGYALFSLFTDSGEALFIKIVVAAAAVSVIILFAASLSDRIKEGKTDKYKDILK